MSTGRWKAAMHRRCNLRFGEIHPGCEFDSLTLFSRRIHMASEIMRESK
jgi:hypothetical protein